MASKLIPYFNTGGHHYSVSVTKNRKGVCSKAFCETGTTEFAPNFNHDGGGCDF